MPSFISPAPSDAWRSRFEPSGASASFTWRQRSRSSPIALVDVRERLRRPRRVGDVDAGDEPVARVEADAEPRVAVEGVDEGGELVDRAAHRPSRAGGVLEDEPESLVRELEQLAERRHRALYPAREPLAEVRADVEDDPVGADRGAVSSDARIAVDGLPVDRPVGRCEVDEVERVTDDARRSRLLASRAERATSSSECGSAATSAGSA